jgi:alpha-galactosidase/6-phospho-beta-glucosidase family protein
MKKHQSYPTGSKPFLEVNGIFVQKTRKNQRYRYEKKMEKKRRQSFKKQHIIPQEVETQ